MRDPAIIQAEIDSLREAQSLGVLSVAQGGRTVTYRSLDEISTLINAREAELAQVTGQTATARRRPIIRIHHAGRGL